MFQFAGFASPFRGYRAFSAVGCPIRKSRDQGSFAPSPGLSQLVTSFIACGSLGIHRMPFPASCRNGMHAHATHGRQHSRLRILSVALYLRRAPALGRRLHGRGETLLLLVCIVSKIDMSPHRQGRSSGKAERTEGLREGSREGAGRHHACTAAMPVSRKEVFQPHLPVRLPCYDLAPITGFALGRSSRRRTSGAPGFHGLTGGVYKARERIHRAMADARLLANPASRSRVADSGPN